MFSNFRNQKYAQHSSCVQLFSEYIAKDLKVFSPLFPILGVLLKLGTQIPEITRNDSIKFRVSENGSGTE